MPRAAQNLLGPDRNMAANLTSSAANAIVREGFKRNSVTTGKIVPIYFAVFLVTCLTAVLLWSVVWVCARCVVGLTGNAQASVVQAAAHARLTDPRSLFSNIALDFSLFVGPPLVAAAVVSVVCTLYLLVATIDEEM